MMKSMDAYIFVHCLLCN